MDKDFADGAAQALVHGKAFAAPIAGGSEAAQLLANRTAGFFTPFPNGFDKLLTPEVMSCYSLFGQIALYNHLSGYTGVVGARLP